MRSIAACLLLAHAIVANAPIQPPHLVLIPAGAPLPVVNAAKKLAGDMGWPDTWVLTTGTNPDVSVSMTATGLGGEKYQLVVSGTTQLVNAGSAAGAVNGIHGLRRRLMEAGVTGPPIAVNTAVITPSFTRRGMMVAPYAFGGQEGHEVFGADSWGIDEWKEYVDYLRLLNANVLELFPLRMWNHTRSRSFLEKARYDVWREVLHYCHDVGMEFHYVMLLNEVTPDFWWQNPGLRLGGTGWQGTSASSLLTSTQTLASEQQDTYDQFEEADAFVFMWNDGGAVDYSTTYRNSPRPSLVNQVTFAHNQLLAAAARANDPTPPRMIFWGWLMQGWFEIAMLIQPALKTTALQQFYPAILTDLRNIGFPMDWLQESARYYPQLPNPLVDPFPPTFNNGAGFTNIDGYLYMTNPEVPREAAPRPMSRECAADMLAMFQSVAPGNIRRVTGITGYRLTPASRRLNDYIVLRLAEDITLGSTGAESGLAAFLARGNPSGITAAANAISALENAMPLPSAAPPQQMSSPYGAAALAFDSVAINNPDWNRARTLTHFFELVYKWGATPGSNTFDLVWSFVQNNELLRAFTTQSGADYESQAMLEGYMRRFQ